MRIRPTASVESVCRPLPVQACLSLHMDEIRFFAMIGLRDDLLSTEIYWRTGGDRKVLGGTTLSLEDIDSRG